jgi:hypothetical protein
MVRSRLELKSLGLCALVAGLMAFACSAAQAEIGATWSLKNSSGTLVTIPGGTDLLPEVQVKELENQSMSILFTTGGGTKVEILCTSAVLAEKIKLTANGGLSLGKATFHGCLTKLNGTLSKPCEPFSGASKGLIESLKFTGLIILHKLANGTLDPLTSLTPDTGNVFAHLALGEECSIGEELLMSGSLVAKDSAGSTETVEHLLEQGPLTNLTVLGQPASIDGSLILKLVGAHEGLAWAGLAA